jgi:hypothetical protein
LCSPNAAHQNRRGRIRTSLPCSRSAHAGRGKTKAVGLLCSPNAHTGRKGTTRISFLCSRSAHAGLIRFTNCGRCSLHGRSGSDMRTLQKRHNNLLERTIYIGGARPGAHVGHLIPGLEIQPTTRWREIKTASAVARANVQVHRTGARTPHLWKNTGIGMESKRAVAQRCSHYAPRVAQPRPLGKSTGTQRKKNWKKTASAVARL